MVWLLLEEHLFVSSSTSFPEVLDRPFFNSDKPRPCPTFSQKFSVYLERSKRCDFFLHDLPSSLVSLPLSSEMTMISFTPTHNTCFTIGAVSAAGAPPIYPCVSVVSFPSAAPDWAFSTPALWPGYSFPSAFECQDRGLSIFKYPRRRIIFTYNVWIQWNFFWFCWILVLAKVSKETVFAPATL